MACGALRAGRLALVIAGSLLAVGPLGADEVLLHGGGRVRGEVVEENARVVVIETGPGRVTLPRSRVERILGGPSAIAEFRERAVAIAPTDAVAWAALARWAADRDLLTQSREAWRRVLEIDPGHPEANAALGRVELDGVWMTAVEANRARGLVPFEDRWVTPAEHEALVRERSAEEAASLAREEAALRVREAEARAREAEARAREAEAEADTSSTGEAEGIPLWWGGGGPLYPPTGYPPVGGPPGHRPGRPHHPADNPPSGPPGGGSSAPPPKPPPSLSPGHAPAQAHPLPLGPAPERPVRRD